MEIQTTIKEFPEKIKQLGIPPDAAIRVILDDQVVNDPKEGCEKSRWAVAADLISRTSPLSKEAAEHLRKHSRQFRGNSPH